MRSKKLYIVLIAILIIFFLVMFLTIGAGNILQENYKATLIVDNHTVWNYHNKKWNNIPMTFENIQSLNWKKYEIFQEHKKIGDYFLWHDDQWYAFDDERNPVELEDMFLAYEANYDLGVVDYLEDDVLDLNAVQSVLVERNISPDSTFTNASHVAIDFDKDGVVEDFYLITNAFSLDEVDSDIYFSFVFMLKNQNIYMIYDDVKQGNSYNMCKPFFHSFLDVNRDNTYEFLLSCGGYSLSEHRNWLYQYDEGTFKILVSNQ